MADGYYFKRMVLRDPAHEPGPDGGVVLLDPAGGGQLPRAESIARAGKWPLVETNEGDPDAEYQCFRTWGAAPGLWMSYLEDLSTRTSVLIVFGPDEADVGELSRRVLLMFSLRSYSREELLSMPGHGDERERIKAVLRAALAMGDTFDEELFSVISSASRDPREMVRVAAAWSTTYLSCPQSLNMLETMARTDPDDQVRHQADDLLAQYR
ncbi:HEAT repeat-containing protein [Saccharopolyspora antimicrobica]|uniref:HEAT repeat protein n=1 Tax=Saccharopolyspora antimicrobica TaxID=455193 RepID=A0A1I4TV73_9PSEU|nr:HEAT repeat domain-containing protein [Saccharopolyspora antimicrobica]RKT88568.1 HEAT repeat protein [Saccharopolyspora antimicrobica]SFM80589.1 HEAT repeat-containing protein [Saccharopolyspora antimicrobica]